MYAVIRTGGKQYRVAPDDIIEIEKLAGSAGDVIEFSDVLMLGGDGTARVGTPVVSGATVAAEVVDQKRAPKIIVFKKKRRKNYRRKHGHRQELTAVRITEIRIDGKKPAKAKAAVEEAPAEAEAAEKPAAAKAEAVKPEAEAKTEAAKPAKKPAAEKKPAKSEKDS